MKNNKITIFFNNTINNNINNIKTNYKYISLNKLSNKTLITDFFNKNKNNVNFEIIDKKIMKNKKKKLLNNHKIFDYFKNNRTRQKSKILKINKFIILQIFSYLDLTSWFRIGSTCYKFHIFCNYTYKKNSYFKEIKLDKFSAGELRKINNSNRLYFKLINLIIKAKNIFSFFSKNEVYFELELYNNEIIKKHELLYSFHVVPKNCFNSFGIDDTVLKFIISNSFISLKILILKNCDLIKNWKSLSLLTNLEVLNVDNNYHFQEYDLEVILINCKKLKKISISNCYQLLYNTLDIISNNGHSLEELDLSNNTIKDNLFTFKYLENLKNLKILNISRIKHLKSSNFIEILTTLNLNTLIINDLKEFNKGYFINILYKTKIIIKNLEIKNIYLKEEIINVSNNLLINII